MSICEACEAIATLARQRCFEFTACCQAAMNDLTLASQVRAALALDAATSHLEVDIRARDGALSIRGGVSNTREVTEVQRIASEVPGVVSLNLDELASPVRA